VQCFIYLFYFICLPDTTWWCGTKKTLPFRFKLHIDL